MLTVLLSSFYLMVCQNFIDRKNNLSVCNVALIAKVFF